MIKWNVISAETYSPLYLYRFKQLQSFTGKCRFRAFSALLSVTVKSKPVTIRCFANIIWQSSTKSRQGKKKNSHLLVNERPRVVEQGEDLYTIHATCAQKCQCITVSLLSSTGNIYWTDQGFDVIEVARLNGSFRYVVISQGLDKPRAITVHPEKGWERAALCNFYLGTLSWYWWLGKLLLSFAVFAHVATCSGQSGASIPALSGLA